MHGVRVEVDGVPRTATDSLGRYGVSPLGIGAHELRFVASGFTARRITALLSDASDIELDIELSPSVVVLPTISVTVPTPLATPLDWPIGADGTHELGRYRIARGWQGDMLAQGVDIQKALVTLPGVVGRGENATSLSIRGGGTSDNLMLLDGIPILGASHFGNAASAIVPDAISFMDVHTGVSSARFGGRLSGVVELETADSAADGGTVGGAVSGSDVRGLLRGSIGGARGGYLVGARTSFGNPWQVGDGFKQEADYRDFIGVARLAATGGSLRVVSFLSGNRLGLQPVSADDVEPTPAARLAAGTTLGWNSSTLGASWTRLTATGGEARLRAWYAGAGTSISWVPTGGAAELRSRVSEVGLSAEVGFESARGSQLIGASVVRPATSYVVNQLSVDSTTFSTKATRIASPAVASLFGEWSWRPSTQLVARAGLRGNASTYGEVNLEPRLDLTVRLSSTTHVDLGAGRTHQTLQSMFNEENLLGTLIGLELPLAAGGNLPTASADQLGIGLEHRVSTRFTITMDSYLRRWNGAALPAGTTGGLFVADSLVIGRGHASGVIIGAAFAGRALAARASVALASSVREYGGQAYHAGVEQPWSVTGGLDYRLGHRMVAQLSFGTGTGEPSSVTGSGVDWLPDHLPTLTGELSGTPVNLPGPVNVERLPGYTRLDLGVRRNWPIGLAGLHGALSTTIRIRNLLDTPNGIGLASPTSGSLRIVRGAPRGVTLELGWIF